MILCLETSTAVCSVALVENGKVIVTTEPIEEAPIAEPVPPVLEAKTASVKPQAVNLFNFICQQKAQ